MRNVYWALVMIAILAGSGVAFTQFNYMTMEKQVFQCSPGDLECLRKASQYMDDCIPSRFSVEGDNLTLVVDVTRGPGDCTYREDELNSGYSTNCTVPVGEGGCEGSLFDYMVPPEGGGGEGPPGDGGGDGLPPVPPEWERPELYCSLGDFQCKEQSVYYVKNCLPATITDDDQRWASGYWTKYVEVDRTDGYCEFYFEILNAVDIPPEVPPNIVGMTMECTIPLTEFPLEEVTEEWCYGPLFEYVTI